VACLEAAPPNNRMNPTAGGGLVPDWHLRSPAAGYAGRSANTEYDDSKRCAGRGLFFKEEVILCQFISSSPIQSVKGVGR